MGLRKKQQLVEHLAGFVSVARRARIESVLGQRTRILTLVLDDVYHPHNVSAVLRSCECLGVQDVHVIGDSTKYRVNSQVAVGASRWLTLVRYGETTTGQAAYCAMGLRRRGYELVAAMPHRDAVLLDDFEVQRPLAVFFGNEEEGLDQATLGRMDHQMNIPMYGFTESFNVSVSAALILRELMAKVRRSGLAWQLTEDEKTDLRLEWLRRMVRGSALIERRYIEEMRL